MGKLDFSPTNLFKKEIENPDLFAYRRAMANLPQSGTEFAPEIKPQTQSVKPFPQGVQEIPQIPKSDLQAQTQTQPTESDIQKLQSQYVQSLIEKPQTVEKPKTWWEGLSNLLNAINTPGITKLGALRESDPYGKLGYLSAAKELEQQEAAKLQAAQQQAEQKQKERADIIKEKMKGETEQEKEKLRIAAEEPTRELNRKLAEFTMKERTESGKRAGEEMKLKQESAKREQMKPAIEQFKKPQEAVIYQQYPDYFVAEGGTKSKLPIVGGLLGGGTELRQIKPIPFKSVAEIDPTLPSGTKIIVNGKLMVWEQGK